MATRVVSIVFCGCVLSGCTAVESYQLIEPSGTLDAKRGYAYTLAKGVVLLKVLAEPANAKFTVCLSRPVPLEDDRHRYVLQHKNSPFSADKLTVDYHPNTNILKSVKLSAIDQTDKFIINLAGAAGSLSVFPQSGEIGDCTADRSTSIPLANVYIDPTSRESISERMAVANKVVYDFARGALKQCKEPQSTAGRSYTWDACREYERIVTRHFSSTWPVSMQWELPRQSWPEATPEYCSTGLCYRPLMEHTVHVSVAGSAVFSMPFSLPNSSPLVAIDVTRGIAITKVSNITFDGLGQPTEVKILKGADDGTDGAEAVELALVPAAAVGAFFKSASASLTAMSTALTDQSKLIQAETNLLNQKVTLEDAKRGSVKPQSGERDDLRFVMSVSNAVLSQSAQRPQDLASVTPPSTEMGESSGASSGISSAKEGASDLGESRPIGN